MLSDQELKSIETKRRLSEEDLREVEAFWPQNKLFVIQYVPRLVAEVRRLSASLAAIHYASRQGYSAETIAGECEKALPQLKEVRMQKPGEPEGGWRAAKGVLKLEPGETPEGLVAELRGHKVDELKAENAALKKELEEYRSLARCAMKAADVPRPDS